MRRPSRCGSTWWRSSGNNERVRSRRAVMRGLDPRIHHASEGFFEDGWIAGQAGNDEYRARMTDYLDINRRNWDERAAIHARDATCDYMLDRFRDGEDALHGIEAAELGDISGKRVLHLQCHIGRDTLCLARRGATVTGLDFSGAALEIARHLAAETGLQAEFVEGTVGQAPDLAPGP